MKLAVFCFTFLLQLNAQYVNPGVQLGYAFGEGFSFKVKVSIGTVIKDGFTNVTFGYNWVSNKKSELYKHSFAQVQVGLLDSGNSLNFTGIGYGFINKNGNRYPKYSLFRGMLTYINYDLIKINKTYYSDLNIEASFLIPLLGHNYDSFKF